MREVRVSFRLLVPRIEILSPRTGQIFPPGTTTVSMNVVLEDLPEGVFWHLRWSSPFSGTVAEGVPVPEGNTYEIIPLHDGQVVRLYVALGTEDGQLFSPLVSSSVTFLVGTAISVGGLQYHLLFPTHLARQVTREVVNRSGLTPSDQELFLYAMEETLLEPFLPGYGDESSSLYFPSAEERVALIPHTFGNPWTIPRIELANDLASRVPLGRLLGAPILSLYVHASPDVTAVRFVLKPPEGAPLERLASWETERIPHSFVLDERAAFGASRPLDVERRSAGRDGGRPSLCSRSRRGRISYLYVGRHDENP